MFRKSSLALVIYLVAALSPAWANVALPQMFGSHMVLQRGTSVRVWGSANPGEPVTVSFNGQNATGQGDSNASWAVTLSSMVANAVGQPLAVTGPSNGVTFSDVVVGDVFLCSGQSNMWYPLSSCTPNGAADASGTNLPNLRMITVPLDIKAAPVTDISAQWFNAVPASQTLLAQFSGLAFYVGVNLVQTQGVPIGLIGAAYYGMPAEAFMSRESILADPALALAAAPLAGPFSTAYNDSYPTGVYNAMIAPWTGYALKGFLWDQGETNQDNTNYGTGAHGWLPSNQYKTLMPELVKDWRMKWKANLPLVQVQLQNMSDLNPDGSYKAWSGPTTCIPGIGLADVRWGQLETLRMPLTGTSINIDLNPNPKSTDNNVVYHPTNKSDFANRMLPWVHRLVYGASIPLTFTGPLYDSYTVGTGAVTVHFNLPTSGTNLATSNAGPVTGFQIAPAGSTNFVFADAVIQGNNVVVSSASVPNPGVVRYAWSQNPVDPNGPVANLSDNLGYLASPFMTYDRSDMIVTNAGVTVPDLNMTPLVADGTDFGTVGFSQAVTQTFTIANAANAGQALTLTGGVGNYVRVSGPQASDFMVTQPAAYILAPGATTTFQVVFQEYPFEGLRQAVIQIPCNTPSKTPYTIYLQGTILNNWTPTATPVGTWFTSTPTNTITHTATYTASPTPAIAVTIIDNFEDTSGVAATHNCLWGGPWGTNKDGASSFAAAYTSPGANLTTNAVSLYGTIATNGYSNYYCCLYGDCHGYNAAAAGQTGIEFWIYGDGHTYRAQVQTVVVTDYDNYGFNITPPSGQWTFVQIPFSDMTREGWGTLTGLPVHPTATDVTGVKFDTKFTGSFVYLLDQVSFYNVLPTPTRTATMTPTITPTPTGTWLTDTPTQTASPTFTATSTSTRTYSPTVTATRTGTIIPPTATHTVPPDTTTYHFETSAMGWTIGNGQVTASSQGAFGTAYMGTGSLKVTLNSPGSGDAEIEIHPSPALNLTGKTITAQLWIPIGFTGWADIFIKSGASWCWQAGSQPALVAGAWNTLTIDPATAATASCTKDLTLVQSIGIQVGSNAAFTGDIYIDSVDIIPHDLPTATRTATNTRTFTITPGTATSTATHSSTWTGTATSTSTTGVGATGTFTHTVSVTGTATQTASLSTTPSTTSTAPPATQTSSPSATPSRTNTTTSTHTFEPTATHTSTMSVSPTASRTPSFTPTRTPTSTQTLSATPSPTDSLSPTVTPTPTDTATPMPGMDLPYPNPSDGTGVVTVQHHLETAADRVTLRVYTTAYRKVYENSNLDPSAGTHVYGLDWSLANLKPGNGLYHMVLVEQRGKSETRNRMKLLIKK